MYLKISPLDISVIHYCICLVWFN